MVDAPPIHGQYESVQEQFSVISAHAQENFSGIRVIKAFAQEPHEAEAFAAHNREYIRRNLAVIKTEGTLWPLMSFFLGLAAVVLLWQGGQAVIAGRITLGQFVQFIGYLGQLAWPMVALGGVVNLMQPGLASMKGPDESFMQRPRIVEPAGAQALPAPRGEVEFRRVGFSYNGSQVLSGIDLHVPAGTTGAVVRPPGAGKRKVGHLLPSVV